jgi:hypothetical protein
MTLIATVCASSPSARSAQHRSCFEGAEALPDPGIRRNGAVHRRLNETLRAFVFPQHREDFVAHFRRYLGAAQ